jgi:hypothetical protein
MFASQGENSAAAADFDVIGMCSETKNRPNLIEANPHHVSQG